MTRSELVEQLAALFPNLVQKDAQQSVDIILGAVVDALAHGNRVEIRGFGSFHVNKRRPRIGRNPKTGEKVQVGEKYVPAFKAGKELRERVDYSK